MKIIDMQEFKNKKDVNNFNFADVYKKALETDRELKKAMERLNQRMELREEKSRKKVEADRKGAHSRLGKSIESRSSVF